MVDYINLTNEYLQKTFFVERKIPDYSFTPQDYVNYNTSSSFTMEVTFDLNIAHYIDKPLMEVYIDEGADFITSGTMYAYDLTDTTITYFAVSFTVVNGKFNAFFYNANHGFYLDHQYKFKIVSNQNTPSSSKYGKIRIYFTDLYLGIFDDPMEIHFWVDVDSADRVKE